MSYISKARISDRATLWHTTPLWIVRHVVVAALIPLAACAGGAEPPDKTFNLAKARAERGEELARRFPDKPAKLRPLYARLEAEGKRNRVLNLMEIGVTALASNDLEHARNAFDRVLDGIESIWGTGEAAKKARQLWYNEDKKIFKGAPYERVMAYYYRGLIYLANHQYGNARAVFRAGQIQDAFAEEQNHRADFALMKYLEGWASKCRGDPDLASKAFAKAKEFNSGLPIPNEGQNAIVIAELGYSPRKVTDGVGHYQLKYRRARSNETQATLISDTDALSSKDLPRAENIFWQATTRGGRKIDEFLGNKVKFRNQAAASGETMAEVGTSVVQISPALSAGSSVVGGAAGVAVVGSALMKVATKTKARADSRFWHTLPSYVHLRPMAQSNVGDSAQVRFAAPDGSHLRTRPVRWLNSMTENAASETEACRVAWTRSRTPSAALKQGNLAK